MLNSYGVGGTDLDSKLRSDVLVGEQGFSEETGLMAPSVELDQLQVHTKSVFVSGNGKIKLNLWFWHCKTRAVLFVWPYIHFRCSYLILYVLLY